MLKSPRRKVVKYWVHDLYYPRYKLECGHVVPGNRHRWIKGVLTQPKTISCAQCAIEVA